VALRGAFFDATPTPQSTLENVPASRKKAEKSVVLIWKEVSLKK
jgi:hypothetical protein